jgi:hypothetical protein
MQSQLAISRNLGHHFPIVLRFSPNGVNNKAQIDIRAKHAFRHVSGGKWMLVTRGKAQTKPVHLFWEIVIVLHIVRLGPSMDDKSDINGERCLLALFIAIT